MTHRCALGLISGTSADGVTTAVINIDESNKKKPVELIAHRTYPYPAQLRRRVLAAVDMKTPEISRLNFELGEFFARAAGDEVRRLKIKNPKLSVEIIGSHGQTIYHGPDDRPANTLQIGEPAIIAERLGLPVIADFRPGDMAAGGQGAPLAPFFDWFRFHRLAPVICLNIGGIANITIVSEKPEHVIAFDTGPGNCLMDLAVSLSTRGRMAYDQDGRRAGRGTIDDAALRRACGHAYFLKNPPKSTGRELFNQNFLERGFGKIKRIEDKLATLAALTAETISTAIKKFPRSPVLASGGGVHNLLLMKLLKERLPGHPIAPTDHYGVHAEAKEAMAFALMAWCAWRGRPNHLPQTTGATGKPQILGKLIT
ncbi:MAG: anhydro-N-acetylmuramic acid kinase [Elusimicrobia bacterium]|nr:anhydro-N-acetylmuramic acid kinase [Elusimicrobiota bacterium]